MKKDNKKYLNLFARKSKLLNNFVYTKIRKTL